MDNVQILILFLYAILVIYVGIYPGSISGREGFLISGRKLHVLSSGFTIAASKIGGGLLVTYSTLVFTYGLQAIWLFVGYTIGYILFYFFAAKIHAESKDKKYYTMADYFQQHYGKLVGLLIGFLCTVSLAGWILTNLIAGGKLLSELSGWPILFTTSVIAVTIGAYLLAGGFNSVVRTDVIQYFSLLIIAVVIGIAMFSIQEVNVALSANKFIEMPGFTIVSFILIGIIFPMGSAELWQRVYATESKKELGLAIALSSVSFFVVGGILSYVCFMLQEIGVTGGDIAAELGLVVGVSEVVQQINPLLVAFWFIAFAAAILSSADTFIYTTAAVFVQDIMLRFGFIKEEKVVPWIKMIIIFLIVFGVFGAIIFSDVIKVTYYFLGISLVVGIVGFFTWYKKSVWQYSVFLSACIGFLMTTYQALLFGISINTVVVAILVTIIAFFIVESVYRIIKRIRQ